MAASAGTFFQHVLLLLLCCLLFPTAMIMALDCFPPDLQALRAFAPNVASGSEDYDYDGVYGSLEEIWGPGNDCCSWQGINCSVSTSGEPPRVSGLSIYIFSFSNVSSTSNFLEPLCNLSLLSTLHLQSTSESTRPDFYTRIPGCLGHLSAMRSLSLHFLYLQGPLPSSLSHLVHLEVLDIPCNQGSSLSGTLLPITNLPNLTYVDLSVCGFVGPLPPFRSPLLQYLDLSENSFNSTLLDFTLLSNLPSLTTLQLFRNRISGSIPPSIARLSNLVTLNLYSNSLSGEIPQSFCKLGRLVQLQLSGSFSAFNTSLDSLQCTFINLTYLDLAGNRFTGPFPRWIGRSPALQDLDLSENDFRGPLPDEWKSLRKLESFHLSGNSVLPSQFDARLPDWLFQFPLQYFYLDSCGLQTHDLSCSGKLSLLNQSLQELDLWDNHLTGRDTLECLALHNFSQLTSLSLSANPLSIVLSHGLLPPHVRDIHLSSCNLKGVDPLANGPFSFYSIDLSHNALAMDLPSLLAGIGLNCDPKHNFTTGIDLSHNALVGEIPSFLGLCNKNLATIEIDNNALVGRIPYELGGLASLRILTLNNNFLVGHIPDELGGLTSLEILRLNNNSLTGTIPPSIIGSNRVLAFLDLSHNELEGNLNSLFSFSGTTYLRFVLLSHNRINGSIPLSFGTYMPDLQLIDFSNNRLTGSIPQKLHLPYFQNLQAMNMNLTTHPFSAMGALGEEVWLVVKGSELQYPYLLQDMTYFDLSGNYLEGNIPEEMGDLASLFFLNLSHNNLSGPIPSTLAKLSQLQSLDLSSNQLEGPLPPHLSNLTKLSNFNVSFNAGLRGSIPQGPQFETSESYKGDPHLCGSPTLQDCKPSPTVVPDTMSAQHTTSARPAGSIIARWIDEWIALPGLSLGIVIGFGTTLFLLHYKR